MKYTIHTGKPCASATTCNNGGKNSNMILHENTLKSFDCSYLRDKTAVSTNILIIYTERSYRRLYSGLHAHVSYSLESMKYQ